MGEEINLFFHASLAQVNKVNIVREKKVKRSLRTLAYLNFIGFSQGSLEEIKGLIRQVCQDGFLKSKLDSSLDDLGINLKEIKGLLKESKGLLMESKELPKESKGVVSSDFLKSLKGTELTYEMFIEIINKTDWLFRKLVESLEKKLNNPGSLKKKYQEEVDKFDEELKNIVNKAKHEPR